MKKSILAIAIIGGMTLMSCNKEKNSATDNLDREMSSETETFKLKESGFSIHELTPLSEIKNEVYTKGILEYKKNGEVLATFNYADVSEDKNGKVNIDGEDKKCGFGHQGDWGGKNKAYWKKGKGKKYKKVVVEPIVKTEDCDYIVSGIIKYYSLKTGSFLASVDFGDGTCDDIAIKTKADGTSFQFNISEYFK